ncbi:hypothetical protein [Aquabacterium sp.]|uniref:hypothetical protein n=1 Tax=Aquabacterium sp. TaxID=1872578 RepID=UPI0025C1E689|nr:hypothetical protein [Aquabacterium sp.]
MAIDALPAAPAPTDSRATFMAKAFAWVTALVTWTTQANAQAVATDLSEANAAASAANAAASAAAAQAVAGAIAFNAATNYAQYQAAISTVNLLTYRRKTAGISATDPSADAANWAPVGLAPVVVQAIAVNTAAVAGVVYLVTATGVELTLPAAAGDQDLVRYRMAPGVTSFTLKRNGNKIENVADDFLVDIANVSGVLHLDATYGWLHI